MGDTLENRIKKFFDEVRRYPRKKKRVDSVLLEEEDGIRIVEEALGSWQTLLSEVQNVTVDLTLDSWRKDPERVELLLSQSEKVLVALSSLGSSILIPKLNPLQEEVITDLSSFLRDISDLVDTYLPGTVFQRPDIVVEQIFASNVILARSRVWKHIQRLKQYRREAKAVALPSTKWTTPKHLSKFGCLLSIILIPAILLLPYWIPEPYSTWMKWVATTYAWWTVLLWFPTLFFGWTSHSRANWVLIFVFLAILACLWSYGFLFGSLVSIILFSPMIRLFNQDKQTINFDAQSVLSRIIYRGGGFAFLIVGLITQQYIWYIAAMIWLIFIVIARTSYASFRHTFDMIAAIDDGVEDPSLIRRKMFYYSLVATVFVTTPGVMGQLQGGFVQQIYAEVSVIAFGLIAILIGVQAIIPSIATWGAVSSHESVSRTEIREMKLYLRHQLGLFGFIRIFFFVFLASLVGWIATGLPWNTQPGIDLSSSAMLSRTPNIFGVAFQGMHLSLEPTLTLANTLLFVGFLSLFFYSVATMYFLFVVSNSLTLPIKGALMSLPAVIEKSTIPTGDDLADVLQRVKQRLQAARQLRGMLFSEVNITENDARTISCSISVIEDFTSIAELTDKVLSILRTVFEVREINEMHILFFRESLGTLATQKLFDVKLDKDECAFIREKTHGMDTIYKLRQLGATYHYYLLPESQLL
jgi:hypothetical protein